MDNAQKIKHLLKKRPAFHGREAAGSHNYSIQRKVLYELLEIVKPHSATLETGCGYSTIAFALLSKRHTVISPFPQEHLLIKQWCREQGIPINHIDFISQPSQTSIHSLAADPLDAVLIDGDHAFPVPFIDWYYTADRLVTGGYLIIDDIQIRAAKILHLFLAAEKGRWQLAKTIGKTSFFQKIASEPLDRPIAWHQQPFNATFKSRLLWQAGNIRKKIKL